jgi:MarR family transcriptional regulator, 2-MHQ and catechol-resistance regulon repressor
LSQFGVLEALYHKEELTSQELSRKILKSKGNMTLVIDNLEKKGLIQRRRCVDDRRKVYVRLTDAGRECIAEVFPQHAEAIVHHMSVLNPQELEELGRICRKLGLTLEEAL